MPNNDFDYAVQRGRLEAQRAKPNPRSQSPALPMRRANMESDDSSLMAYAQQRAATDAPGSIGKSKVTHKAAINQPWVPQVGAARPFANDADTAPPPGTQGYNRKREVNSHGAVSGHEVPFGVDSSQVGDQRRGKVAGEFKVVKTQPFGTDTNNHTSNSQGMQSKVRNNCAASVDHLNGIINGATYNQGGSEYHKTNDEMYDKANFGRVHHPQPKTDIFNPDQSRSQAAGAGLQMVAEKNYNEPWGKLGDPSGQPGHHDARRGPQHFKDPHVQAGGPYATEQEVFYPPKRRMAGKVNAEWAKEPEGSPFALDADASRNQREQVNKGIKSAEDRYAIRPTPFGIDPNYGVPFNKAGKEQPEIGGNVGGWGLKLTDESRAVRPSPFAREDGVAPPAATAGLRMGQQRQVQLAVPFGNPGDDNEGNNPHGINRGKVQHAQAKTDPFSWA